MDSEAIAALTTEKLADFRTQFSSDEKTIFAQNVVSRSDPLETCLSRKALEAARHIYSHKVDEVKPVTNQKSSGRCWLFACLNAMRIPFTKENNLEDFEFSQGFVFFWDKVERCNYFLNNMANLYKREPKETVDGRLMNFLLKDPIMDGGQWDMVVNIIKKHGVMPKKCYPETFSCESSHHMNGILKSKLREFAHDIHDKYDSGATDVDVQELIRQQMTTIFRIVGICLGVPPTEFTWEYYDKSKEYHKVGPISPLEFYNSYVKKLFDVDEKVCLVSDPRASNPVGHTYTVDCLGNVVGGRKTIYNNQPIETLIEVTAKSIKAGEAVWFGCEVSKFLASKQGLLDLDIYDYKLVFGTDVNLGLNKAQRLLYGDSEMTHAMVFSAIHQEEDNVTKWRVENSWGEDRNEKGYLMMTTNWFKEFVFEVVVDKKYCSQEVLDVYTKDPVVLPAWDPMGSLAKS